MSDAQSPFWVHPSDVTLTLNPSLSELPLIHISIATSTGALALFSPPNSGERPEFEVPQNWEI